MFVLAILVAISPAILAQENASSNNSTTNETPTTPPEPAGPVEITILGQGGEGTFWWTVEGYEGRNPTLSVPTGAEVTFHFETITGAVHNLKVGDLPVSKAIAEGAAPIDYVWTAPETDGSVVYICTIHGKAMSGTINVGAAPAPGGGEGAGAITGETIDLADVGHPECAGVRIPAIVTSTVGGPTVQDYADRCKTSGPSTAGRESHPVDYVIPGSVVLIGLGIVGVVWVHRYYKP